jgi:hypothetical protein
MLSENAEWLYIMSMGYKLVSRNDLDRENFLLFYCKFINHIELQIRRIEYKSKCNRRLTGPSSTENPLYPWTPIIFPQHLMLTEF